MNGPDAASTVNVPGDRRLMPAWAADGSGVLLGGGLTSSADPVGILRPDGTVSDASGAALELACRTRDAPFQDPLIVRRPFPKIWRLPLK